MVALEKVRDGELRLDRTIEVSVTNTAEKQRIMSRIVSAWLSADLAVGSTMVLTEPDAGSDVGNGTSKAVHIEGSTYHLEGVKRFITSGASDYHENIIHLVLARRPGAVAGTKGLSLFIA